MQVKQRRMWRRVPGLRRTELAPALPSQGPVAEGGWASSPGGGDLGQALWCQPEGE